MTTMIDEDAPPADLGPAPDPLGFRWFGDPSGNSTWNLKSIASAYRPCSAPTPSTTEVVEGLDRPLPVKDPTSVDPVSKRGSRN